MGCPWQRLEPAWGDRLAAAQARAERAVVESSQGRIHQRQLGDRPVAQGQVALLLEDLGRGGGLRSVRHLAGGDDGFAEFRGEAVVFGGEGRPDGGEARVTHRPTVARQTGPGLRGYTGREYQKED